RGDQAVSLALPPAAAGLFEGTTAASRLLRAELELCARLRGLAFGEPVRYVYNPLEYAWEMHSCYVNTYCHDGQDVLFLGMNPGPFGMAQTGVVFSVPSLVDFCRAAHTDTHRHALSHPQPRGSKVVRSAKKGVRGRGGGRGVVFQPTGTARSIHTLNWVQMGVHAQKAASGRQLRQQGDSRAASGARSRLTGGSAAASVVFVAVAGGTAGTLLRKAQRRAPRRALGAAGMEVRVEGLMHPSPRNPLANKGWEGIARARLEELGILALL
uniref:Single-strand-selective monofunctional uracil-DNA glycosylase 1 n=1 Tax=Lepisosteus oculatus TaxID=7918 RepID=W5MHC5_LEPOC